MKSCLSAKTIMAATVGIALLVFIAHQGAPKLLKSGDVASVRGAVASDEAEAAPNDGPLFNETEPVEKEEESVGDVPAKDNDNKAPADNRKRLTDGCRWVYLGGFLSGRRRSRRRRPAFQ